MITDTPGTPCPCGSGHTYASCCGRWHEGPEHLMAPNAEALMRSRYSAYVKERPDYLLDTWHPSRRDTDLPRLQAGVRWLGLEVRRHVVVDDNHAEVEFVARSKLGGRAHRMHENSRFVREAGRWFYLDGDER